MQITNVEIYNFKSIAHIKLDLTNLIDKTTLITADNRDEEGSSSNRGGKSNFTKALVWCLFGVGSIEGTTDEIVRYGEKECYVILKFDSGIEIERRLKGKAQTFYYKVNGIDKSDSNKDAESLFLQDIGLVEKNRAIISNGIYLNTSANNLISSSPSERLKIFTDWFNLNKYDEAVTLVRDKAKEWEIELSQVDTIIEQSKDAKNSAEIAEKAIRELQSTIANLIKKKEELEQSQKVYDNYDALRSQALSVKSQLDSLKEQNSEIEQAKKEISQFNIDSLKKEQELITKEINEFSNKVIELKKEIRTLGSQISEPLICPVCKSHLLTSGKELVQVSEEENKKLTCEISAKKVELEALTEPDESRLDSIDKDIHQYYSLDRIASKELKDTTELETQLQTLLGSLKEKPENYSESIKNANISISSLSVDLGKYKSDYEFYSNLLDKAEDATKRSVELTEQLRLAELWAGKRTKTGLYQEIKSLQFSLILRNLELISNNILNNHFFIDSKIEIESTSKGIEIYQVVDEERHPTASMSSGERARVAFALALALKQLYSTKLDILICDEFFGSLDTTGMEFVMKTFDTFKGQKFVISHVTCESEHQINLVKEKGVTYAL